MFAGQVAHLCIHPHNTGWTWQNERETFASFVLPQQPSTLNFSSSLFHHYSSFISSQDGNTTYWVMWGHAKRVKSPRTELTFSIDVRYSVNMSEPRVKRIKTCLPLCKAHISSAGSLARQNFPTVVEESLCGVSTLLMEVSYKLEALVRTLL